MSKSDDFIVGLIVGGLLGAVIGILYAPKPGKETREEIGLDLDRYGRLLGHLDYMNVNPIGTSYDMLIVPFVFAVEGELPPFRPNHEVAAVIWGSVQGMYHGDSVIRRDMHVAGEKRSFPGFGVENEIVWGLTYRMLHGFFAVLDPAWRIPDEW